MMFLIRSYLTCQELQEAERLKAEQLARQHQELHARRALEFQRQKTKSMEEEARRKHEEEEVVPKLYLIPGL